MKFLALSLFVLFSSFSFSKDFKQSVQELKKTLKQIKVHRDELEQFTRNQPEYMKHENYAKCLEAKKAKKKTIKYCQSILKPASKYREKNQELNRQNQYELKRLVKQSEEQYQELKDIFWGREKNSVTCDPVLKRNHALDEKTQTQIKKGNTKVNYSLIVKDKVGVSFILPFYGKYICPKLGTNILPKEEIECYNKGNQEFREKYSERLSSFFPLIDNFLNDMEAQIFNYEKVVASEKWEEVKCSDPVNDTPREVQEKSDSPSKESSKPVKTIKK